MQAAIDAQPRGAWWFGRPGLAALVCAAVLLIAVITGFTLRQWSDAQPAVDPVAANRPESSPTLDDDVEQDAAWAVVRTAADDLEYDDALAEGISARPGAFESVAMELSAAERAELVRLIEREMKRPGA